MTFVYSHRASMDRKKLREKRKQRIRGKITKKKDIPRLCIYKSNKHLYAQLINDETGKTLLYLSDKSLGKTKKTEGKNLKVATSLGEALSDKAKKKKITNVVFDRSGYPYHGRIKLFAEAARRGGLKF